ncbi:hypothetical protein ACQP1P_46190 [Dactylosporangium sp. CA-052675]|uniref:hypothetical protein n=1 Tax=Dactylosporangium sp. CA-052675 TaxID=3239927 RepID=UPI003D8F42E7
MMRDQTQILAYADLLAKRLSQDMKWVARDGAYTGGYWQADDNAALHRIEARATSVLEFLRRYAGEDSYWTRRAFDIFQSKGGNVSSETGARAIGELLHAWADQVDAGVIEIVGTREWAEAGVVSTDVMSQVRRLNEDRDNHPAAAIVLCGAALEIALRALADARNVARPPKATISVLSGALRQAGILTVQDVKDIEALGGVRNLAAHGDFDQLSADRAGLMEQHTNLLLRRLADLHP